jgi:hypothetical protein
LNELRCNFQGVAVIYAVIRRISDAYVWNGSAFVVWNDADVASYDVSLASLGGDLYAADMPAVIAASDYRVVFYQQIAGSPATNDYIVGTPKEFHWDGTATSSVSSVTASPYALATLDQAKQDLGITDGVDDTALTEDINQVTALIERICRRKFVARNWRERIDGCQQDKIKLKQYPVVQLTRIAFGYAQAMSIGYSGSGIRANAAIYNDYSSSASGGLRLVTISSLGVPTENNLTFASYPSLSLLAAAVSGVTGWTATAISNQPSADLNPTAVGNCLNRTLYLTYPDQVWDEYMMDLQAGLLQLQSQISPVPLNLVESRTPLRAPYGFQSLLVEYRAGFESVPDDLNMFAREEVKARYEDRQGTNAVKSESVGPFSATYDMDAERGKELRMQLEAAGYIDASKGIA